MNASIRDELRPSAALRDLALAVTIIGIGVGTGSSALFSGGAFEAVDVVFETGAVVLAAWALARLIAGTGKDEGASPKHF